MTMRALALALVMALVVAGGAADAAAEIIDRIVAVVGTQAIMLSDVRAARDLGLVDPGPSADPDRAALGRLIERALIQAEVERYAPPEPAAAAVDAELARIRRRVGAEERFDALLARSGIDESHVRAMIRDDLRIRAYLAQRFQETDETRRAALVADWVAGLRERALIVELY